MIKVCTKGIWNESVPGIKFDSDGVSNYYHLQKILENNFPRGEKGTEIWKNIIEDIKEKGKNNRYDCIIGVSGGVDSSYLLHVAKNVYGLRPLAVNLDNGWSTDIAVKNIQKITKKLNIDLETYVINYQEIKDLLRSYIRASLPWIDTPTDMAIKGALYKIANRENIKFILRGNDFRSEGKQPREWTYSDYKQLKYVHKMFGSGTKLKTFPFLNNFNLVYYGYIKKIKEVRPYYYIDYKKQEAKNMLMEIYDWQDYGGHHHENIFTKFAMSYWLPQKFGIDKRLIHLSAQVASNAISREEALRQISTPFETPEKLEDTKNYVLKKLDISQEEFLQIWKSPNKSFMDYPNNFVMIQKILKYGKPVISRIYKQKPMSFFEMEARNEK
ncbi:MAG: N-acetyl sugar amidotransferase [Flavobacterium sp.]|nr:MAG: N-acetyl sugar amidotransferase [Flavobacterium sp.]